MQIHFSHNVAESLKNLQMDLDITSRMVSNFHGTRVSHTYKKMQKSYRMR